MLLAVAAQALGIKQLEIGKVLFATSVLRASHLQQTQVPAPSCTVCMWSCRLDCHVIRNITLFTTTHIQMSQHSYCLTFSQYGAL